MAIFSPTITAGNSLDIPSLQTVLESLAVKKYNGSFGSVTSHDPSIDDDWQTISTLSALTDAMSTDEIAVVVSTFSVSAPSQADRWYVRLYQGSNGGTTHYYISSKTGDSTGEVNTITLVEAWTGLSGAQTFTTKWARNGASGDGIYSRRGTMSVFVLKAGN